MGRRRRAPWGSSRICYASMAPPPPGGAPGRSRRVTAPHCPAESLTVKLTLPPARTARRVRRPPRRRRWPRASDKKKPAARAAAGQEGAPRQERAWEEEDKAPRGLALASAWRLGGLGRPLQPSRGCRHARCYGLGSVRGQADEGARRLSGSMAGQRAACVAYIHQLSHLEALYNGATLTHA
eukprot:scaffold1414_cov384-Prasinococcus_capsulatus_cf.AAC.15